MKKIILAVMYTIVVLIISPVSVNAQKADIAFNSQAAGQSFLSSGTGFAGTKANNLNIRAVRDFVKTFKAVENNKLSYTKEGGLAFTFTANDIATTVLYDNKGYREFVIRTYEESRLPADIRHRVKREYYDDTITLVKEVESWDGRVFFIHLEDKDSRKIVSLADIADGEMKLVEDVKTGRRS